MVGGGPIAEELPLMVGESSWDEDSATGQTAPAPCKQNLNFIKYTRHKIIHERPPHNNRENIRERESETRYESGRKGWGHLNIKSGWEFSKRDNHTEWQWEGSRMTIYW